MTAENVQTSGNPFRYRLRRKYVSFKTTVWQANAEGKDSSAGKTDFALNNDYLWIAYDFSVPLRWITSVRNLGPGFVVTWHNGLNGGEEAAAFCVRTMFGYNLRKRDELVQRIAAAAESARKSPQAEAISSAAAIPRCQVCGASNVTVYDFAWMFSVVALLLNKPDRRVLCPTHARWRLRSVCACNLVTANLGFGVFVSPIINIHNVREGRKAHALSAGEAFVWMAIGFWPYALLATLVGWSIWYAVHF